MFSLHYYVALCYNDIKYHVYWNKTYYSLNVLTYYQFIDMPPTLSGALLHSPRKMAPAARPVRTDVMMALNDSACLMIRCIVM